MVIANTKSQRLRISGLTMIGHKDHPRALDIGIRLQNCRDFRIDQCRLEHFGHAGVLVYDYFGRVDMQGSGGLEPGAAVPYSRGVVDHCEVIDCYKREIDNYGYGVVVHHGRKFDDSLKPGCAEAVFIEDCLFVGARHAVASNSAARYVFRHNVVRKNARAHHAIDAHGPAYGGNGAQWSEIYENVVEKHERKGAAVVLRGGGGVIFNNTFKDVKYGVRLQLEAGKQNQTGPYPRPRQVRDVWVWNNTLDGAPSEPHVPRQEWSFYIQKDRDYFCRPKPGYEPYAYPHPLTQEEQAVAAR
jgi:hypothetical protein